MTPDQDPEAFTRLGQQNANLAAALDRAKGVIEQQQGEIEKLSSPPQAFGVFIEAGPRGTADVMSAGRRARVESLIPVTKLDPGQTVVFNEAGVILAAEGYEKRGLLAKVEEIVSGNRVLVTTGSDDHLLVSIAAAVLDEPLRPGDSLLVDPKAGFAYEVITRDESAELLLEEVPDISYADVGGLAAQVEKIQDAVELPYAHPEKFKKYKRTPPGGILLYGPPGCGKTLIAKAVANSLAKRAETKAYFINVRGPELLNKYVGETERKIREIFQRARDKASEGHPVVIFFDEMEAMFRTRGSGVSSDVESTIVPQLLVEMDGVAETRNVIVIGASNRQDLIDPAILRPGRLDVKIKVERPDEDAARQILSLYLTDELPYAKRSDVDVRDCMAYLIDETVFEIYAETKDTEFLEVTYVDGKREKLHFKDFTSGAMLQNIVDRAKTAAIKDELAGLGEGITLDHLTQAVAAEFHENESLPNTTNPDDWARISGVKGERIANVRPLLKKDETKSRDVDDVLGRQYL
jgi:proteasome-associated ATPase